MKIGLQSFRLLILGLLILTAILWIVFFKDIFSVDEDSRGVLPHLAYLADMVYYLVLPIFAIIIVIRAQQNRGNLLFALFLLLNCLSPILPYVSNYVGQITSNIIIALYITLAMSLLLKTFQYFPKPINSTDVKETFVSPGLRKILIWMLSGKAIVVYTILSFVCLVLPFNIVYDVFFIASVIVVIALLYVNSRKSKLDHNKVMWLFWGLSIYVTALILITIFEFFEGYGVSLITNILSIISVIGLLFAFMMSLFFANTFDTGVIVKRTIINSFIFISIIIIYNAGEHYFLHWVSHKLRISDVLLSSIFSGILVMIFSPLHHKLTHYLELKLKGKNQ